MQFDKDPNETFIGKHCHGAFTLLIDCGADEKLALAKGCDLIFEVEFQDRSLFYVGLF